MGYRINLKEGGVIVFSKVFATAEERTAYIASLQSKFTYEEVSEGGGGVEEAPIDTKQYGRKDAGWTEVVAGGAPEGTAVKSTGETGGTKFLREDGDGTCSWQTASGSPTVATGTEVDTGTDNTKMVTPKAMEDSSYVKLGETSATAYRGDGGKTAYDHSQETHAPNNADNTASVIFNAETLKPGDADLLGAVEVSTELLKSISISDLKATLKEYFDTIYTPL